MYNSLFYLLALVTILLPTVVFGENTFVPLNTGGIPGLPSTDAWTTEELLKNIYKLSIGIAALLVVGRLMMGGVKYMFSEVVNKKSEAKEDIKQALLGLLIILAAVTILNTINSNLNNLNVLGNADPTTAGKGGAEGGGEGAVDDRDCDRVLVEGDCGCDRHLEYDGGASYTCVDD